MIGWSDMLPEVLDIIARKNITFYEDYLSFAGVCKSWRLAATRNGPPSRLPYLMLSCKSEDKDDKEFRKLFLLSNKSIRKIRLPEAYGKACRFSSCGWLLTVAEDFASQLINPLSREIINLPEVYTFSNDIHPSEWEYLISKVVLVLESKLVLVIWGRDKKLGFCHTGDNYWTSVLYSSGIRDITFYNGHVYTFSRCGDIEACNINGKDPTRLVHVKSTIILDDKCVYSAYIVGLDDGERKQLLVIIKYGINITMGFQVFAYDLESRNLSKVKDLGTKTLFVGYNSSFWTEETRGMIKGNCIYYTDDMVKADVFADEGRDMGIYHLSDGPIELHFAGELFSRLTPPIWLQSM